MKDLFYTKKQLKVFAEDLHDTFVKSGFDIVDEPYIDYSLYGFRATYMRRYLMHMPTTAYDGILTTLVHVVGLPFGHQGQKMVVLSMPRTAKNEPLSPTIKLRLYFDDDGTSHVIYGENQTTASSRLNHEEAQQVFFSNHDPASGLSFVTTRHGPVLTQQPNEQFSQDLSRYVYHVIEEISPGLIQLPNEMKLEILKKLSVESIMKMSQVNTEFRTLIFQHGESLWRHLCHRDFKIKKINRASHGSWMELYRDSYLIVQLEKCRKERALPGLPERPALPPVPYRLQIGWIPEVMQPLYPMAAVDFHREELQLAIEPQLLRRADSLDSIV